MLPGFGVEETTDFSAIWSLKKRWLQFRQSGNKVILTKKRMINPRRFKATKTRHTKRTTTGEEKSTRRRCFRRGQAVKTITIGNHALQTPPTTRGLRHGIILSRTVIRVDRALEAMGHSGHIHNNTRGKTKVLSFHLLRKTGFFCN